MTAAQKLCSECHNPAPAAAQFCMKCGERFPVSAFNQNVNENETAFASNFNETAAERACPNCRRVLGAFERNCLHCEREREAAPPGNAPPVSAPPPFPPSCRAPSYAAPLPQPTQTPHIQCLNCRQWVPQRAGQCLTCGALMPSSNFSAAPAPFQNSYYPLTPYRPRKDKIAAGLFGILLGTFGGQHFYLGNTGAGILSVLFCWTYIPTLIGLIQGILFLCMDDEEFHLRHG